MRTPLIIFVAFLISSGHSVQAKQAEPTPPELTKEMVKNVPEEKLFPFLGPARPASSSLLSSALLNGANDHDRRIILDEIYSRHADWAPEDKALIEARKVRIGMMDKQVLSSWGEPKERNKTVGSWGVHEQWIYGERYIYIQNGVLTSYQE